MSQALASPRSPRGRPLRTIEPVLLVRGNVSFLIARTARKVLKGLGNDAARTDLKVRFRRSESESGLTAHGPNELVNQFVFLPAVVAEGETSWDFHSAISHRRSDVFGIQPGRSARNERLSRDRCGQFGSSSIAKVDCEIARALISQSISNCAAAILKIMIGTLVVCPRSDPARLWSKKQVVPFNLS